LSVAGKESKRVLAYTEVRNLSVVRQKLTSKDMKMSLKKTKESFMSLPLPRESYHIKQKKMKSFQLNPLSSGNGDGTEHAEQVRAPENSFVSNILELSKRN
jgi:hypothetical protein